jgi:hypothetical protein
MGDFTTISAASHAMKTLLETYITDDVVAPLAGTTIDLRTPEELRKANANNVISLWCYRVNRSADLLNQPDKRIPPNRIKRRPFPFELHYLITPFATASEDEQTLLGRVIQVLNDHTVMRGPDIPASVAGVLPPEIRVNFEALSLEEITRVWHALQADYQLSVSYQIQLLEIESMQEPVLGSPVLVRDAEITQIVG